MHIYVIEIHLKDLPYYSAQNKILKSYRYEKFGSLISAKRLATKNVKSLLMYKMCPLHFEIRIYLKENFDWVASQFLSFGNDKEGKILRICNTQKSEWYTTGMGRFVSFQEKNYPELSLDSDILNQHYRNR